MGAASAQTNTPSLIVQGQTSLGTAGTESNPNNTYIEGNLQLGESNANTITYNGIAVTDIDLGDNSLDNVNTLNLGDPSSISSPYSPTTGTIIMYNENSTGSTSILAANPSTSNWTYTIPNAGTNANFVMTAGAQSIAGAKTFTTPIAAGSGGTGNGTYAKGDVLYAASASPASLTRLAIGSTGQVLGVTASGVPGYINSGAQLTYTLASDPVPTTENPFAPGGASANYLRLTNGNGSPVTITGINTTGFTSGSVITIVNVSTGSPSDYIVLSNLDGSNSTPSGYQFDLPGGNNVILGLKGAATLIYDSNLGHWELLSVND